MHPARVHPLSADCCAIACRAMDDATSTLMQLRFVTSESTFSYFEALDLYLAAHGRPVAFYSDKHTVFRVATQSAKSGHGMTTDRQSFACKR